MIRETNNLWDCFAPLKGRNAAMELTKNFEVKELAVTETGIYNTPGQVELEKLLLLAVYLLQPLRDKFGRVKVTSGYRSKAVNDRVGGSMTSQHLTGEASDIIPLDAPLDIVFAWAKDNLKFGQLILEQKNGKEWIHVSLPRIAKQNQMAMTYKNGIYVNV